MASQFLQQSLWPAEHRALATQAVAHFASAARAHLDFPRCVEARCRGGFSSGVEARFLFLLPLDGRARGEASVEARSPFLLPLDGRARGEASVEAGLKNYPNPEQIPERNVALTRELGAAAMRGLLAKCYR